MDRYHDPRDRDDRGDRFFDRHRSDDRYRSDDRPRYADHGQYGSEIDRDRDRDRAGDGGPRYHGDGWDRVGREPDPRHTDRHDPDPRYGFDHRRAQGYSPDIDRQSRRHGEDPMDEGERRRYHGGWDRVDDRARTGRGMGGDTYGGQDRGYDSLIRPMDAERGRYDVGRYDMPDRYRGEDGWMMRDRDDRRDDRHGGGSFGGEHAGMRHRR
jgi:hypothetical protein